MHYQFDSSSLVSRLYIITLAGLLLLLLACGGGKSTTDNTPPPAGDNNPPGGDKPAPSPPQPEPSAGNLVHISWTASPEYDAVSGYRIYLGKSAIDSGVLLTEVSLTATDFDPAAPAWSFDRETELKLKQSETACFKVQSVNHLGISEPSLVKCITL